MWIGLLHIRACSRRYGILRWRRWWKRTRTDERGEGGGRGADERGKNRDAPDWHEGLRLLAALRQLGGVRRGIEIANAHYGYFPIEGRMPLPVSYYASRSFSFRSLPAYLSRPLLLVFSFVLSFIPLLFHSSHAIRPISPLSHVLSSHLCLLTHIVPIQLPPCLVLSSLFLILSPTSSQSYAFALLPLPLRRKRKCTRWKACTQSLSFPHFLFLPISDIPTSYVNCPPSLLYRFSPRYASLPILSSPDFSLCSPFVPLFPYLPSARSVLSASIQTNTTHLYMHRVTTDISKSRIRPIRTLL